MLQIFLDYISDVSDLIRIIKQVVFLFCFESKETSSYNLMLYFTLEKNNSREPASTNILIRINMKQNHEGILQEARVPYLIQIFWFQITPWISSTSITM
jgi:hypothetical protein